MAGLLTRVRPPAWVQDALLAGFVTLMQISGVRGTASTAEVAEPDLLGYGLLAASGLVLVARRRHPVPVFGLTAAISIWYYAAGYPDGPTWLALFIAIYTLTAHGDGRWSLLIATGGLLVLTPIWLFTADLEPRAEAGWVFFRIGSAVMAAALGESVRSRRVIAAEAVARAERAERTREEEARRRVDAERLRIAREVHDTVAHAIAIVNVQAGVSAHVLDRRPEQAREALVTIEQTSARALRELRDTLGVLRDTDAERDRVPVAGLGQLDGITAMAREAGLDVKVDASAPATPPELPSAVDRAAYRILQESITNAIRHAGPARVTIAIRHTADELVVQVTDDGRGPTGTADGGRGIAGMRERCALLGGELTAGPGPDRGFRVRARLPLAPAATVAS